MSQQANPKRPRRSSNGAILVEATIIIATFTLLFIAMVFFRQLYVNATKLAWSARGSAMYYAMVGCNDNNGAPPPDQWLGTDRGSNSADAQRNDQNTEGASSDGSSSEADSILSSPQVSNSNGINPMTRVRIAGDTSVGVRRGFSNDTVFHKNLDSFSHVSCADRTREGNFSEAVGYIWGLITSG